MFFKISESLRGTKFHEFSRWDLHVTACFGQVDLQPPPVSVEQVGTPTTRACFFHHPKSYASPEDMYCNKSISFGMLLGFELKVGTLPAFGVCCFSVIKPEKSWASGSACDPRRTSSATDSFGKEIIGDVTRVSKDFQRKLAAAHKEADDRHGCAWTAAVCMTRCSPSTCLLLLLPLQVWCPAKGTGQQTSFDTESHGKGQFLPAPDNSNEFSWLSQCGDLPWLNSYTDTLSLLCSSCAVATEALANMMCTAVAVATCCNPGLWENAAWDVVR